MAWNKALKQRGFKKCSEDGNGPCCSLADMVSKHPAMEYENLESPLESMHPFQAVSVPCK